MSLQEQFRLMIDNMPKNIVEIAEDAGVHQNTIYKGRRDITHLNIYTFLAIVSACGCRLEIVKDEGLEEKYAEER